MLPMKMNCIACILLLTSMASNACPLDKYDMYGVDIYMTDYFFGNEGFMPVDQVRRVSFTTIKSSNIAYADTLKDLICKQSFDAQYKNIDDHPNYIVIDFRISSLGMSELTFSVDGEYLYGPDGKKAKIDKAFRTRFHFSDHDIGVYTF